MSLLLKQVSPQCNYKSHLCLHNPGGITVLWKKEDLFLTDVSRAPSQMVWSPKARGCSTFSGVSCPHCQSWPQKRCHRSVYLCYQGSRERDPPKWKTLLHHQSGGRESPELVNAQNAQQHNWNTSKQHLLAGKWRRSAQESLRFKTQNYLLLYWADSVEGFQNSQKSQKWAGEQVS